MNLNLLQNVLSLKTWLSLYLALTLKKFKKFKFFFQIIKSATIPDHHVKGQPAAPTYVREKGCLKSHSNREIPCILSTDSTLKFPTPSVHRLGLIRSIIEDRQQMFG